MQRELAVSNKKEALIVSLVLTISLFLLAFVRAASLQGEGSQIPDISSSADSVYSAVRTEIDPKSDVSPAQTLSICSQHAPKCPLTAAGWLGEPDGWQYTGKKWIWVPDTRDLNRSVVWEYSQPYSGSTQEYFGQREDHYAFCSGDPDDCSLIGGTKPVTYDWERWLQVGDNFKVMQLGVESENESHKIGDVDCDSGIYYPVVDHTTPYAYTPMYSDISGACTGGGYVAAHLSELWGEPLSQKRLALCDNTVNGMPADLSQAGNTICKISPYVGVVFQRYLFDSAPPNNMPGLGCEAVLYAWGWSEPRSPASGQQYQTWFRNGELRFTRWYNLTNQMTAGDIPQPDDHVWWDSRCQSAWTEEGNWLYTGTFRVGDAEYQDQAALAVPSKTEITPVGGQVILPGSGAQYIFPAGVFTQTVQVVSYLPDQAELPPTDGRFKIAPAHYIFAETPAGQVLGNPAAPYTITLSYSDQIGSLENSLAFYSWDGYQWLKEPSSQVDIGSNTLTAMPDHFSLWAAMVDGRRVYLPAVLLAK